MQRDNRVVSVKRQTGLVAAIAAALLTGACSGGLGNMDVGQSLGLGQPEPAVTETAEVPRSELDRAIEHWGKQYEKNPKDAKNALAFAKNLKAAGRKPEALQVLQQASFFHGNNREIASEYGRLALEAGQVSLAQKLLAFADDPAKPDWRVISARGTALAKQGSYAEAIPLFQRAATLAPSQASVQSNLAMAYVANGEPAKAEEILRRASANSDDAKVRQNLALVVGLQGKYSEARTIAAADLPPEAATANVEFVRNMVRIPESRPAPAVHQAKASPSAPVIQAKTLPREKPDLRPAAPDTQMATTTVGGWDTRVAVGR